jgi:serine/threonine protein kinase
MPADERRSSPSAAVSDGSSLVAGGGLPVRKDLPSNEKQPLADTATTMGEGYGTRRTRGSDAFEVPGIGHELGPVKLMKEVGRGAMGVVFVGYHRLLGRSVAVKFLRFTADHEAPPPSAPTAASPVTARGKGARNDLPPPGSWDRFFGEARAAAAVRHPNLAEVYHADLAPGRGAPYIVFEYVDGPTLGQLLQYAGRFEANTAITVLSDIANAMAELHDRGIIHRDIKPSNVLVDANGRVVVTDFGLAVRRVSPNALAQDEETAGTPGYMAPEIFDGRASTRSDVYALAVLAYQMLTGKLPFEGSLADVKQKHISAPFPSDALRKCGATEELIEVLERAAHKQVVFRHKTARELSRALAKLPKCGDAAAARAELARLVANVRDNGGVGMLAGEPHPVLPANSGSSTTPPPPAAPLGYASAPPAEGLSPQYTEALARHAAVKRERQASAVPAWMRPSGPPREIPTASFAPGTAPPVSVDFPLVPARTRRSRRGLWITLSIIGAVLFLCIAACVGAWLVTR